MGHPWLLLLPVALSALYGLTEWRAMAVLGWTRAHARGSWFLAFLPTAAAAVLWAGGGFPLPLFYLLFYLALALRFLRGGPGRAKALFFQNLHYVNSLTLHLVFIGAAALIRGVTMHELLADPSWRAVSVSFMLLVLTAEDVVYLRVMRLGAAIAAIAESPEARPFMAFLWFSNGYLLVDSLLCVNDLEPFYAPLFLLGSSVLLILFQIRFLLHMDSLIRSNHLREEHDALTAQLEERDRSVGTLRRLAERDALTGAISRRSAMERLSALLASGQAFALAFLDLDHLKQVNDREGHDAGDRYLIRFVGALGARLRDGDVLARMGGDEFVVLMPGCSGTAADRRIGAIREDLLGEGFSFSYGVAGVPPGTGKDAAGLLGEADRAMYQDKSRRR